jgi:ssRNA-specific RNase YbeY (16S rRNA maturation enzyme)
MKKAKGRKLLEGRVRRAVGKALRAMGRSPRAIDLFFLSDGAMRELKRATAGVETNEVDVLAFEALAGFPHPDRKEFLGEVYVNAERFGTGPERVLRLALHGVAHLFGFRHERARDTIEMERVEKKLLAHARDGFL